MKDCPVCCGSRKILIPLQRMADAVVAAEDAWKMPAAIERTSREYPCPECGDYAPFDRLTVVKEIRDEPQEIMGEARESIRRGMAALLGDYMLRHNLIAFEERAADRNGYPVVETRARVGVVAPKRVATFEERVRERQFDVAERFIEAYSAEISNWGSHYGVATVQKAQAIAWLREVFQRVKRIVKAEGYAGSTR